MEFKRNVNRLYALVDMQIALFPDTLNYSQVMQYVQRSLRFVQIHFCRCHIISRCKLAFDFIRNKAPVIVSRFLTSQRN